MFNLLLYLFAIFLCFLFLLFLSLSFLSVLFCLFLSSSFFFWSEFLCLLSLRLLLYFFLLLFLLLLYLLLSTILYLFKIRRELYISIFWRVELAFTELRKAFLVWASVHCHCVPIYGCKIWLIIEPLGSQLEFKHPLWTTKFTTRYRTRLLFITCPERMDHTFLLLWVPKNLCWLICSDNFKKLVIFTDLSIVCMMLVNEFL